MSGTERWRAIRRGPIYCAPACGLGCKWVDYQTATRRAERLALSLGPAWEPHVWENLGWHHSVRAKGRKWTGEVHVNHGRFGRQASYWADFMLDGRQFYATARTPRKAVALALYKANRAATALGSAMAAISGRRLIPAGASRAIAASADL